MTAIEFSGGKDSTALMYVVRDMFPDAIVYFVDTGSAFPHVLDHVHSTCARLGAILKVVKTNVRAHVDKYGLPADVVPIDALYDMQNVVKERIGLVQSYMQCCSQMIMMPLDKAIRADGHTKIIRGAKRSDRRIGVSPGTIFEGIEYSSPLWDWTDQDVLTYLRENKIEFPAHYNEVNDSLDCWICTAHLPYQGAEKFAYMKKHYPQYINEVSERFKRLHRITEFHTSRALDTIKGV